MCETPVSEFYQKRTQVSMRELEKMSPKHTGKSSSTFIGDPAVSVAPSAGSAIAMLWARAEAAKNSGMRKDFIVNRTWS